jgi:hypothetical protein
MRSPDLHWFYFVADPAPGIFTAWDHRKPEQPPYSNQIKCEPDSQDSANFCIIPAGNLSAQQGTGYLVVDPERDLLVVDRRHIGAWLRDNQSAGFQLCLLSRFHALDGPVGTAW